MKNHYILQIGTTPDSAGYGGVSVHVERLLQHLDKNDFRNYRFVDYKKVTFLTLLKIIPKYTCVHIHISNPYVRFLISWYAWLCKSTVLVTFHGNCARFKGLRNQIVRMTAHVVDYPIAINELSYEYCKNVNPNALLIPAFIPPQDDAPLDEKSKFILDDIKGKNQQIYSTNAYNASIDAAGNETYGIGFLINFFKERNNSILLISDPSGYYHRKYGECGEHIKFIPYPHNYFEILKRADFFVRNTSTDGDALSVKESLFLGCRTLCTDVVDRPEGCVLFHYCDEDSLTKAIEQASTCTESPRNVEDGTGPLLDLFNKILDTKVNP